MIKVSLKERYFTWICDAHPPPGIIEHATQSSLSSRINVIATTTTTPTKLWWGMALHEAPQVWRRRCISKRCANGLDIVIETLESGDLFIDLFFDDAHRNDVWPYRIVPIVGATTTCERCHDESRQRRWCGANLSPETSSFLIHSFTHTLLLFFFSLSNKHHLPTCLFSSKIQTLILWCDG